MVPAAAHERRHVVLQRGKLGERRCAVLAHQQLAVLAPQLAARKLRHQPAHIGGGAGHMVAAMAHHYPKLKGIVFDLPKVVASSAKDTLAELRVSDRVSTVGGSFLEPLPAALSSCDAFYLKFILHDWADEECVSILSAIKAVAKEGSQIVTSDFILGVDGANMEMAKRNMDINMMASNPPGAGERTFEEYAALFARAGFAKPSELVKLRDLISTVVTEV